MPGKMALLIAAHGDRGGTGANRALLAHCQRLEAGAGFSTVAGGVLKGDPPLEAALEQIVASGAAHLLVYPLFMADGYFTRKVLPHRLSEHLEAMGRHIKVTYTAPLGADEALPAFTAKRAIKAAERARYKPSESRLLIVGHGSKIGPASADATKEFAKKVSPLVPFARVETAFLEEDVFVKDALRNSGQPTVVEGFFSGDGLHAGDDVPQALEETGAIATYAGSIGADPHLSEIILNAAGALENLVPT